MIKTACIDQEEIYRYTLGRTWHCEKERLLFVMLNPSTADDKDDDQTIKRCIAFADKWGYGGLVVGNLFALRSPHPRDLFQHSDPVGPDNDYDLQRVAEQCKTVVAAWAQKPRPSRRFESAKHTSRASSKAGYR